MKPYRDADGVRVETSTRLEYRVPQSVLLECLSNGSYRSGRPSLSRQGEILSVDVDGEDVVLLIERKEVYPTPRPEPEVLAEVAAKLLAGESAEGVEA